MRLALENSAVKTYAAKLRHEIEKIYEDKNKPTPGHLMSALDLTSV